MVVWLIQTSWLTLLLGTSIVLGFGAAGLSHPLPDYGPGFAIVAEQMERSTKLRDADVLILGDSSTLHGLDVPALDRALGDRRVESLTVIGPARPPGIAKLLERHVARENHPELVVLLMNPLGLFHAFGEDELGTMRAVLTGWPAASFAEEARKALNWRLFRGLLEEPLAGHHGRYYGNAWMLRRTLRQGHGSLPHPNPGSLAQRSRDPSAGDRAVAIHPDALRDLNAMRAILDGLRGERIYLGLAPEPQLLAGGDDARARAELLAELQRLIGLPGDRRLEMPSTLPDEAFADWTHVNAEGRVLYTLAVQRAIEPVLVALDAEKENQQ